jgi:hypothetical protein
VERNFKGQWLLLLVPPLPPKKRRERMSIIDSPNARGAVVNGAAQVYLRFKSTINGELVDRKKQWGRHIEVSLATETAKASGESEPIADLEGWVGRLSTFLTSQWFLKNVKPHLEGMREREITYEEAKPHQIPGPTSFISAAEGARRFSSLFFSSFFFFFLLLLSSFLPLLFRLES